MKASELRIGNWVKDENGFYQIKGEHLDEDNFPTIQTWEIQLTEEWLLKFGFEQTSLHYFKKSGIIIQIEDDGFECFLGNIIVKIIHVHQLQNLYFALIGEELTIGGQDEQR